MDYTRVFNIVKDLYKDASNEDIKTVLSLMGYEEPTDEEVQAKKELEELRELQAKAEANPRTPGLGMPEARKRQLAKERAKRAEEETETIELTPSKEELSMPTPTTKFTFSPAPVPAPIPAPSPEECKEYRNKLFVVYPEIGEIYNEAVADTNTILASRWFTNPKIGSDLAKFVWFIKYLQVEEIFENFARLEKVANLTDGGTVDTPTRNAQKYICDKSFDINRANDEAKKLSITRDVVKYVLGICDNNKEMPQIFVDTFEFCGYDTELVKDLYAAELELQSLLANK